MEFMHNPDKAKLWLILSVGKADLRARHVTHKDFAARTRLDAAFREVAPNPMRKKSGEMIWFEQKRPIRYSRRPSDELHKIRGGVQHLFWPIFRSGAPYRRYYFHLSLGTRANVFHPLVSVYALAFYLGSVTRYRPAHFETIMETDFGPFVGEFLATHGRQFLYGLASEFLRRDVARPAVA